MKLSVIVPVYDVEEFLPRCLDSLIMQEEPSVEFLVINDGSPDNSQKIIDEYCQKDSRLISIEKENGGWGSVVQLGIERAQGEYITILDSDDWYTKPSSVTTFYNEASRNSADLFVLGYSRYNKERDHYAVSPSLPKGKADINGDSKGTLLHCPTVPHGKLYKRTLVENFVFAERVNHNDNLLFKLAWLTAEKIGYNCDIVEAVHWIDRFGNSVGELTDKRIYHEYVVLNQILKNIDALDEVNEVKVGLLYNHLFYIFKHYKSQRKNYGETEMFSSKVDAMTQQLETLFKERGAKITWSGVESHSFFKTAAKYLMTKWA